jgi:phosphatidylinositol glycan class H protein
VGLAAHIATYLLVLARIITGILVATVLLLEYRTSSPAINGVGSLAWLENAILTSPSGQIATLLVANIDKIWRLLLCAGATFLIFRKGYTEESLLVIRGLGVQTSTSSPSYLWTPSTRFIPTSTIQDIFIHEAFKGFEVRYYLMIVVEKEDDVVVVFPVRMLTVQPFEVEHICLLRPQNILPQREILEDVWRGARSCLYELKS